MGAHGLDVPESFSLVGLQEGVERTLGTAEPTKAKVGRLLVSRVAVLMPHRRVTN
jgi:hypothetical protein